MWHPLYSRLGGTENRCGERSTSYSTGVRTPNSPVRKAPQYRLRYPHPQPRKKWRFFQNIIIIIIIIIIVIAIAKHCDVYEVISTNLDFM